MSQLSPVPTSPAAITEAAAMFRAAMNLFRLWGLTDEEAAVLLDQPVRSYRRWKAGEIGRIDRDARALVSVGGFPVTQVAWPGAVRIIRSAFPPIDLFEDIADPADWPLLILAEMKTNPRLMETIGNLDLVPPARRVSGPGASWLMAPFTRVSRDRPSRFSDGSFGALYVAEGFETALFETIHHHGRFMARTKEAPGWTSQFRELVLSIDGNLHDLRGERAGESALLRPDDYAESQELGLRLRAAGSEGIAYPSVRRPGGESAPGCSGSISPAIPSRGGISTIAGTANRSISTARPGPARCSGSARSSLAIEGGTASP